MTLFPKKTIVLNEHPDLAEMLKDSDTVFEVKYIPIAWLPMHVAQKLDEMQEIRGAVEGDAAPTKEQTAEVMAIQLSVIKLMISSWNLTDIDDHPLPLPSVDESSWAKVPMAVQFAIWKSMTSDGTGIEIPLANEKPSSEASTPVEPVLPSPKAEPAVV